MGEMDIVHRLQRRPDQVQGSRLLECLDAADEITRLRAELAAAEARGIAMGLRQRLEQPVTVTESLLGQARAEGIAMGLERAAQWHDEQRRSAEDQAGLTSHNGAVYRALMDDAAWHRTSSRKLRALPHDPSKGDEGRGG